MEKSQLLQAAKGIFDANPEANKIIMTSDGQGFLPSHENDAKAHARRNGLNVETIEKSEVEDLIKQHKAAVDADLKAMKAEADKAAAEAKKAEEDKVKAEKAAAAEAKKAEEDKAKAEKAAAAEAKKAEEDKVKAEEAAAAATEG
jgi:hypothetical protein